MYSRARAEADFPKANQAQTFPGSNTEYDKSLKPDKKTSSNTF